MNEGLVFRQHLQDLQANNQQDNLENQNEKQDPQEDGYLNFHNYIKYQSNEEIQIVQISNDEKYLAIGGRKRVQIYYLKNKKIIKNLKLDDDEYNYIQIIKFSNNSSYIIIGDSKGYLYCCDINNNFKIIYNQMIHSSVINDILTIDDDQILTCSWDKSLIITSIKNNQQLLKIGNAHTSWIKAIDFDKQNDFILSCSNDKSIKFFNRNDGKCQINQQKAHELPIQMIQFISKDNNLISSDYYYQLILWQIDYLGLQLNKLKEFNIFHYDNYIYNFMSVFINNKIVVICEKSFQYQIMIQLYYNQSSTTHKCNVFIIFMIQAYFQTKQLNSLNYIIVPGKYELLILKKVRRLLN